MRRSRLTIVLMVLIIGACSERSDPEVPTSRGEPTPGQEVFPVVASSEIVVGDNRLQIGLIDTNDAPVRSPKTTLELAFLGPGDQEPSSDTSMSFVWTIKPLQGLWVGHASFDRAGTWEAVIDVQGGGYDTTVRTTVEVDEGGTTPVIGAEAPDVDTPTISDVEELSEITTDSDPDPSFYELSISEAVKAAKPAVIVFATPKFCASQVCGPTLTIVKDVSKQFPDVNFIHVEPYDLEKVPEELDPVPAVIAFGLPSEPWVFVTDDRGRVAAKYEGSVAPRELRSLLRDL